MQLITQQTSVFDGFDTPSATQPKGSLVTSFSFSATSFVSRFVGAPDGTYSDGRSLISGAKRWKAVAILTAGTALSPFFLRKNPDFPTQRLRLSFFQSPRLCFIASA